MFFILFWIYVLQCNTKTCYTVRLYMHTFKRSVWGNLCSFVYLRFVADGNKTRHFQQSKRSTIDLKHAAWYIKWFYGLFTVSNKNMNQWELMYCQKERHKHFWDLSMKFSSAKGNQCKLNADFQLWHLRRLELMKTFTT